MHSELRQFFEWDEKFENKFALAEEFQDATTAKEIILT
jgi:inorganic pyrophosphatase